MVDAMKDLDVVTELVQKHKNVWNGKLTEVFVHIVAVGKEVFSNNPMTRAETWSVHRC